MICLLVLDKNVETTKKIDKNVETTKKIDEVCILP